MELIILVLNLRVSENISILRSILILYIILFLMITKRIVEELCTRNKPNEPNTGASENERNCENLHDFV